MRVRFFGVRGSVATPGPSTVRYGGNTVCVEVRLADDTCVILDGGTGIRELGKALIAERYTRPMHLFVTHSHWDHIIGLPFFGPVYSKDATIRVHAMTERSVERFRNPIMFDSVHFPVSFSQLPAKIERVEELGPHRIGSATITHVELNHPGGAIGYRIDDADGTSMCYLTDNELVPPGTPLTSIDELARFAAGTDLLVHDAQYVEADLPAKHGWGHSIVDQVLALAKTAEVRRLALHHHDPERDDDALDAIGATTAAWTREHAKELHTVVAREGLELAL